MASSDLNNLEIKGLLGFNGDLYAFASNDSTGAEVWM